MRDTIYGTMAELLDQLRVWMEQVIRVLGYPGIALLMFLEGVFPPMPSEIIMPLAGAMAARGDLNYLGVIAAGTVGSLLVALFFYALGRQLSKAQTPRTAIQRYGRWLMISMRDWERVNDLLRRYGDVIVLVGRLIPSVRSLVSIPAGLSRMPLGAFLLYSLLGTLMWNALLTRAGVALGRNWDQVLTWVHEYEFLVRVATVLLLAWLVYHYVSRFRQRNLEQPRDKAGGG